MDDLTVSGAFMITIGHGSGPEVIAFIAAEAPDGSPVAVDADRLEVFTGLTAMFGTAAFPCEVVSVESIYPPPIGFLGCTLELRWSDELGRLASLGVASLGVVVTNDSGRGQGVITSAGAATPQTWWADRQPDGPGPR